MVKRSRSSKQRNRRAADLNAVFGALSDPIRRGIVERLGRGEASVGELAEPYNVSAPAISRHLRVLESAGLIERRKQGRIHHCRICPQTVEQASQWIETQRAFWNRQFDQLESYLGAPPKTQKPKT